jgi:signal recognition particle receptor subunit beta
MALVNQVKREINAKIVFFGPGLSGKSTNLKHVHGKLKPEFRGAMKAMSVQDARMLFFDFTPPGDGNVQGFRVRFHVYTVSGAVVEPAAWKMVLKGVDGIVFVADSDPQRTAANQESLASLDAFLQGYGQSLTSVPMVIQYNKCDLPEALAVAELDRMLNPARLPVFQASSRDGEGVLQTLLSLVKAGLNELGGKGLEGVSPPEALQGMVETPVTLAPAQQAQPAPAAPAQAAPEAALASQSAPEPALASPSAPEPREVAVPKSAPSLTAATPAGGAPEEPLSLEISGAPQSAGPGLFRLPLTIRSGTRSKSVLLNISLSLEEE